MNVKYLGNKRLTPTYLKVALYSDYGTDRQQVHYQVFTLRVKNANQELFTVQN